MRNTFRVALLVVLLLSPATPVFAHAMLERASPPVGGLVHKSPADISLRFSEAIEPALSRVSVSTASGMAVAVGALSTDPSDARILIATLPAPLSEGSYHVKWRAVSRDTHTTEGEFTFAVKP